MNYAMLTAGFGTEVAALAGPLLLRGIGGSGQGLNPGLLQHRRLWREPASIGTEQLISLVRAGGILGRGGAEFPFWRKLQATVEAGRRREIVVNGSEGEPASAKDSTLLSVAAHLVLDGAELVADTLGVGVVHVVLPGERPTVIASVQAAIAERATGRRAVSFEIRPTTGGFVGGQSRAVLEMLSGRENLPVTSWQPEAISGLRGRPTLMSNAETFAQVAALHGVGLARYSEMGTSAEPGTRLLSVGADGPGGVVVEVPHGESLPTVLELCGYDPDRPVLLGGYHGSWLRAEQVARSLISPAALARDKVRLGAGVVLPMLPGDCPVAFTAQIVTYLAGRRAQRCGPCVRGLPALALVCEQLAMRGGDRTEPDPVRRIRELCGLVTGRGACQHPDGTARLVISMLNAFGDEVWAHERGGCLLG